ncbi:MAG TPA: hypothetical protein VFI40_05250 [Nocardioides sp.]|nr:hypothetical protein [Nocardioides sp.]
MVEEVAQRPSRNHRRPPAAAGSASVVGRAFSGPSRWWVVAVFWLWKRRRAWFPAAVAGRRLPEVLTHGWLSSPVVEEVARDRLETTGDRNIGTLVKKRPEKILELL